MTRCRRSARNTDPLSQNQIDRRRAGKNEWGNNRVRASDGSFSGIRVNVESVLRLPTFPARWVLVDPRQRASFMFWAGDDGELRILAEEFSTLLKPESWQESNPTLPPTPKA